MTYAQIKKEATYIRTEASDHQENLGGTIGFAHLQFETLTFQINGIEVEFAASEDNDFDNFKKARNLFPEFWSKSPNNKQTGNHGRSYDFTQKKNVGKKYIIYYKKSKFVDKLILLKYKRVE